MSKADADWLDEEIEILAFDIDQLVLARDWHLRAPWDGRLCNQGEWHRALHRQNEHLANMRILLREMLFERAEVWG